MKIGITGGLGLVGKALRGSLSGPVSLLVRRVPEEQLNSNEECIVGNFSDPVITDIFLSNISVLVHAATGVGPRSEFNDQFIRDDLVGTLNLAKAFFRKNPDGHFIYLSTSGGLYNLEDPSVKTEDSEIVPKSLYGAIKLIIEDSLEQICSNNGMVTIVRAAAIYGDSFKKNQDVGLIDKLLKSTLKESTNSLVPIFDKLESARDYLHVDDLAKAIKVLINRNSESRFEIYNVGTGKETSIDEVIKTINSLGEEKVRVEILPTPNNRTSLIVNSNKIFNDVGWKSEISLRDGILKMYQDLKNKDLV
ncbi:NAD-dependent epimerase/dehydratase family protein [Bacteriovorax sp. PP10]|uniref:NAD-dependent epimerase/dehydratase family protein n=1 Tax=Bacteriovorax antarcticus TaxID=3088717 RepID=A0ABU5VW89_9BACT|nr:NAD-dependent epimerase/dehydratase family protein [Bacteriovorax sp. PP10]MEA9356609.1 NAD-dependent epimerase/dehydratase family protein [Bacteriovorax sp. PP10]